MAVTQVRSARFDIARNERGKARGREHLGFASRAVHAGERGPRPDFTPTATPIYPATAFVYDDTDTLDAVFGNERQGYVYTRYANPTTTRPGVGHRVPGRDGRRGRVRLRDGGGLRGDAPRRPGRAAHRRGAGRLRRDLRHSQPAAADAWAIETIFVDLLDLAALEQALTHVATGARLRGDDLESAATGRRSAGGRGAGASARRHGSRSTTRSPRPGWSIPPRSASIRSSTRPPSISAGMATSPAASIATTAERAAALREINKLIGSVAGPFESWLTLRGLKTLPLRMKQQSDNARAVATWLANDSRVSRVNYPGLQDLGAAESMFNRTERGGMISFEVRDAGRDDIFRFFEALQLIVPATTLGDVYSLVLYPTISSHRAVPAEERAKIGISDGLVRLSVGIEDVADIIADLDRALAAADRR